MYIISQLQPTTPENTIFLLQYLEMTVEAQIAPQPEKISVVSFIPTFQVLTQSYERYKIGTRLLVGLKRLENMPTQTQELLRKLFPRIETHQTVATIVDPITIGLDPAFCLEISVNEKNRTLVHFGENGLQSVYTVRTTKDGKQERLLHKNIAGYVSNGGLESACLALAIFNTQRSTNSLRVTPRRI